MPDPWSRSVPMLAATLGLAALVGLSALGVSGWAAHGEAIFLKLAEGAWINCF